MNDEILKLRASIDAIDDRLIALLNERSEFVKKVGAIKHKIHGDKTCFIRPGREALMVRRIAEVFAGGVFPAPAAAQIWRMIISGSLSLESPLSVSALASDAQNEIYWIAREYFGSFTPISRQTSSLRALSDVLDGKSAVAALPFPDSSTEGLWWLKLPEGLRVFACAPFIFTGAQEPQALLVAKIEPEETGKDKTLIRIEADDTVSQSRLKLAFEKQSFAVRWLAAKALAPAKRTHLFELDGFFRQGDKALGLFEKEMGASLLAIDNIGAYAAPLML